MLEVVIEVFPSNRVKTVQSLPVIELLIALLAVAVRCVHRLGRCLQEVLHASGEACIRNLFSCRRSISSGRSVLLEWLRWLDNLISPVGRMSWRHAYEHVSRESRLQVVTVSVGNRHRISNSCLPTDVFNVESICGE